MAFIAALAPFLAIAGAGISAAGAIEQGVATSNMANYNAQVAKNNAQIANQNAEYAINAGQAAAARQSLKSAATAGAIKTGLAASGVDVNTGSAVNVEESQREIEKLDTETVLSDAQLRAYGYRSAATSYKAQSELNTAEASQAPIGAAFKAGGSLLSNASSLGTKWTGGTGTTNDLFSGRY